MAKIIIPNTLVNEMEYYIYPLIFLAGSNSGAPAWQDEACRFLIAKEHENWLAHPRDTEITIVDPSRSLAGDLAEYVTDGDNSHFESHSAWASYYLRMACGEDQDLDGCAVMFWLPREAEHEAESVYGEMRALHQRHPFMKFCVGSDRNAPELKALLCDLNEFALDMELKTSLEEACSEAFAIARKRHNL